MAELTTLLFDLDGTLVRTREASWELFQQTNEKFGLGVDTPSAFFDLFDRNFYVALDEAAASNGHAKGEEVREHLQRLLRTSYTPDLVPGMASVVRALAGHYTLIVISSNTMETVRRILQANDLAHCFAHVFSGDLGPSKHETIRRFLADPSYSSARRCTPNYEESTPPRLHQPGEAMLITDTVGDVDEALQAGIRVVGVIWGMHRAADLERAGAEFVCIWPEELIAYLKPGAACSMGACSFPSAAGENVGATPIEAVTALASESPATPVPAAAARRERRTQSVARTGHRLETKCECRVEDQVRGCGCATTRAPGSQHEERALEPPPSDPLLRQVLATLLRPVPDRVVHPR